MKLSNSMAEFHWNMPHFSISIKGIVQELIHKLNKGHEEIGAIIGNWYMPKI
jgi:hypothetical protein